MCDTAAYTLQSSILIWALSLIPSIILHYALLALVCAFSVIYAANYKRPSTRLSRLNIRITAAVDILARAKSQCPRDYLDLADEEAGLLQIQSCLLEALNTPWKTYLHKMWTIWHSLGKCERQVRKLQTSALLIIEAEHQRKLAEHITESMEVVNVVILSPSGCTLRAQQTVHSIRAEI
ncbi:hypothetical protein B0H17DRAFT_1174361 [Mycena rosella]|uniref:Uncharacterized protein n=1 Tax=Mycena rosella TaxID=1033263 RepID=A0AAD7GYY7_MYCRO|nr:hypothetical protein B0H17DRAFT_1174361 [Mycena rosella]